jgi:hypothetical protein
MLFSIQRVKKIKNTIGWLGLFLSLTMFGIDTASAQSTNPVSSATELRFRDFFRTPIGPRGLELSDTLRRADGQTVTLTGYMVQQEGATVGRFMLTPRPVQMSEHADGDADDLPPATVLVELDPAQKDWAVPHVRGLVSLTGKLAVGRHEGVDGRISWVRLQLGADATRGMNPVEHALKQQSLQHKH